MSSRGRSKKGRQPALANPLMVRLDEQSKAYLAEAAQIRQISVSDYVRAVTVPQARREVESARRRTIVLTPEERLAFWTALNKMPKLTAAQKRLGKLMRGSQ